MEWYWIVLIIFGWLGIGWGAHIWLYLHDFGELDVSDLMVTLVAGLLGILMWVIALCICDKKSNIFEKVIIKNRK